MKNYLQTNGKPAFLYSDKHSVFRVNHGENISKPTQFARAMKELGIELINANSPQAKGRVERANGVLQDRLVKELREHNISTIEEANNFLPTFIDKYNQRFGKPAANPFNAHHPLEHNLDLDKILCNKETRKISKNLEISYKNTIYQINAPNRANRLKGCFVQVIEQMDGTIFIEYQGETLDFIIYEGITVQPKVVDHKELVAQWERICKKRKPNKNHPWRNKSINF